MENRKSEIRNQREKSKDYWGTRRERRRGIPPLRDPARINRAEAEAGALRSG
jgi:hypothetical protein